MAGIRGVRNPMPMKGGKPTNIFSTNGKQKNPPLAASQKKNASMTASQFRGSKVDPVSRDNRIKK